MNPLLAKVNDPASVDAAIVNRFSVRAFLPEPVPRADLEQILSVAARAPSGSNTQPWKVYVLTGASRNALVEKVCAAHDAVRANPELGKQYKGQYDYYPVNWQSPYIDRRRENGWGLYGLLGIERHEHDKMHAQLQRNYRFFDAPVGMIFTIDPTMAQGSLVDTGMFIQSVMIAARARGIHSCPQAAWNNFHSIVLPHVGAKEGELLVCGMSLGYPDESAKVNQFFTPREHHRDFATWLD
jgi:nitroreductase